MAAVPGETPAETWRATLAALRRPSYHHRLHAYQRILHDQTRVLGSREPVWDVVDKLEGYRFAGAHGVPTPEVYGVWDSISEVPFDALPDAFVLKPVKGFYSHGVWALRRQEDGRYLNVLNQRAVTPTQMIKRMVRLRELDYLRQDRVLAEQLLDDGRGSQRPATDWKVYCFYGEVGMVMARDTRGSLRREDMRFRYWDAEWNDLGQANLDNVVDSELPGPRHPSALLAAARTLSAATPRPHIRVDFYDTAEGIRFGEFTLRPGGTHALDPALDRRLGAMWEAAEARLLHDLTVGGYLELGSPEDRRDQRLLGTPGVRALETTPAPPPVTPPPVTPPPERGRRAPWRRGARR